MLLSRCMVSARVLSVAKALPQCATFASLTWTCVGPRRVVIPVAWTCRVRPRYLVRVTAVCGVVLVGSLLSVTLSIRLMLAGILEL